MNIRYFQYMAIPLMLTLGNILNAMDIKSLVPKDEASELFLTTIQIPFIEAVKQNQMRKAGQFLERGADLILKDENGFCAIDYVASLGVRGAAMRMLFYHYNPNIVFPLQLITPKPRVQLPKNRDCATTPTDNQLLQLPEPRDVELPENDDSEESDDSEENSESFLWAQLSGAKHLLRFGASAVKQLLSATQQMDIVPPDNLVFTAANLDERPPDQDPSYLPVQVDQVEQQHPAANTKTDHDLPAQVDQVEPQQLAADIKTHHEKICKALDSSDPELLRSLLAHPYTDINYCLYREVPYYPPSMEDAADYRYDHRIWDNSYAIKGNNITIIELEASAIAWMANIDSHDVFIMSGGGLPPLWMILRLKLSNKYRENKDKDEQCRFVLMEYEATYRKTYKLTAFDDLLRAIVDKNNELVKKIIEMNKNTQFNINGQDSNGLSAIHTAIRVRNYDCIPLLCEAHNFDANLQFKHQHLGHVKSYASPLIELLLPNNNGERESESIFLKDDGGSKMQALACLGERGAALAPEFCVFYTAYYGSQRATRCLVLLTLGLQANINAHEFTGLMNTLFGQTFRSSLSLDLTQFEENRASCFLVTVIGDSYIDKSSSIFPLNIARIYKNEPESDEMRSSYVRHEGLSFKEFVKAQLLNDWAFEPQRVNQQDSLGMTPLIWAAARDNLELAQFLAEFSSINLTPADNIFGFNALHFATRNGHPDMVRFLIELPGQHRTQLTRSGRSPYELAHYCKQTKVIEFLDERNKRRLCLLMCLLRTTRLGRDMFKVLVGQLRF